MNKHCMSVASFKGREPLWGSIGGFLSSHIINIIKIILFSYLHLYFSSQFFHHRLEVIDFIVIILTFVVTVTVEALVYYQHLKYAR